MNTYMKSLWSAVIGIVALLHTASAFAAITIDSFDVTQQFVIVVGFPAGVRSATSVVGAPEAIGAERDIFITRTSTGAGSTSTDVDLTVDGVLAYSAGPFTTGHALVEWDGNDGTANTLDPTGLGGVDLTQGGLNTGIVISVTSDLGTTLELTLYSNGADFSLASIAIPPDPSFTPSLVFIPFSAFSVGGGAGADFGNVGAVTLFIDGSVAALDVLIDLIAAINPNGRGALGDFVWHDLDRDGIQDAGEPGIDGVTVVLKNSVGGVIATDITGPNGFYQFTGLIAGTYIVEVDASTLPPVFVPTLSNVGGNDTVDSDGSPVVATLPTDTSVDPTLDFGYHSPCTGTIGNFVWHDLDRDGIQEAGEPGIDGVVVLLKDSGGNIIAMDITGPNGAYEFTGLCAGAYVVEVDPSTLPPGFLSTLTNAPGSTTNNDSNSSPETVTLPGNNSTDLSIDFGFFQGQLLCPSTDTSGANPAGVLSFFVDINGDVTVRYDQSLNLNDNSYGTNIVNWPRSHSFGDLVGSDKAQFQFRDANGNLVLDFLLDYITAKSGTPSGYASLGVSGGDGRLNAGNAAHILAFDTSLARNLNATGLCTAGNCTVSGVNLLVNSPPADTMYHVLNPVFGQWNFTNSYSMKISHLAFGAAGFGSVSVGEVHNSPPKTGTNAVLPVPCGPPGPPPGGASFCTGKAKPQVLTMQYTGEDCSATSHSQDPSKVSCTGNPALASPVRIVASDKANPSDKKAKVWFDGTVVLNGMFDLDAATAGETKLSADTYVSIFSSTGTFLQSIKFHTSCSQPLNQGDQFGSLVAVGFVPEKKGKP